MRKALVPIGVGLLALAVAVGLRMWDPAPVEQLRRLVFDTYQRIQPREYNPNVPVRVVDIDDDSLARIGQWPWPRTVVADLVVRLQQLGAAVITFDVIFAEPDRTSPAQVAETWELLPGGDASRQAILAQVRNLPDNDALLADVIAGAPVVAGFVPTPQAANYALPERKAGFANAGTDPAAFIERYAGAINNLPILEAASAGNASFSFTPDPDNVIRCVPLLQSVGGVVHPTLSVESLRLVMGASTIVTRSADASGEIAFGDARGMNSVKIGPVEVPTTGDGKLCLHFTSPEPRRFVPAWQILADAPDVPMLQEKLAGQIVLIGTSAPGLRDIRATPLNPVEAGVILHAEAVEQMLLGNATVLGMPENEPFLLRPDWAEGAELLAVVVVGLVLIVLLPFFGAAVCAVIGLVAVAAGVGGSWYAFSELKLLFDPVYPATGAMLVYLATSLVGYLRTEQEKSQVRSAFSQYLSPDLVAQLADDPSRLTLGGETKELSVMFCDVRGFTAISEQYKTNPLGLTKLMNRLLTPLTDAILARRGTIDKYMGDCIMAFWNAPLDNPNHIHDACEAALAMFVALDGVNAENEVLDAQEGRKHVVLKIGVGINTGDVVVGNMGSEQRFDYSVLGDAVNLASRLEGQSKGYGVQTVLGTETARVADSRFAVLELDLIAVKGKQEGVRIFTLLGDRDLKDSPAFQAWKVEHEALLVAYRAQDWDGAEAAIDRALAAGGAETMPDFYDLYRERLAEFRAEPPGPDWDCVYRATSK